MKKLQKQQIGVSLIIDIETYQYKQGIGYVARIISNFLKEYLY